MAFLFNWLKKQPVPPARVPTDTVIPLHGLDDTKTNQSMSLDFSMCFDDVLDVDKLVGALEKLLERPDWRKLGARIRRNSNGKLDYHVPVKYSKERPAVNFSHVTHDMPIAQHPLAPTLPRPTGSAYLSQDLAGLRPLLKPANSPITLSDYLYSDLPQLSLHVVSFEDATLITLTWLHTFLDAIARSQLFKAWTAMLEGREQDVQEAYGYDHDPLAALGATPDSKLKDEDTPAEEEYVLKDKALSGWGAIKFVINFMWELLVYRAEETRVVTISPAFFAKLKSQALKDLDSVPPGTIVMDAASDPAHPKPFLSDGDILCAWFTRLIVSSQPWLPSASPSKTIQIMNVFGMRDLLSTTEPVLIPKGVSYIGNCVTSLVSFFTLQEFLSLPLGLVASRIRSDLVIQSTRLQIEANIRLLKAALAKTGHAPLYGDGGMFFSAFSNWAKGKMFETDFSAAVVKQGTREHSVGKPSIVTADGTVKGFSVRNSGCCAGRDAQGNWWLGSFLRPATWANVQKAIEGMN